MSIRFLNKRDLQAGKWYATNINPSANDAHALGPTNGRDPWDYVLGGPFDSREEGEAWLQRYPEADGPYFRIEYREAAAP